TLLATDSAVGPVRRIARKTKKLSLGVFIRLNSLSSLLSDCPQFLRCRHITSGVSGRYDLIHRLIHAAVAGVEVPAPGVAGYDRVRARRQSRGTEAGMTAAVKKGRAGQRGGGCRARAPFDEGDIAGRRSATARHGSCKGDRLPSGRRIGRGS